MNRFLTILLVLSLLFVLTPFSVIAVDITADKFDGNSIPKLEMTDTQKAKMISLKTQILELKKQIIKDNLEKGIITKEQAERMEKRINTRLDALKSGKLDRIHRHHTPRGKKNQKQE